jgi:rhomboid protease GluP
LNDGSDEYSKALRGEGRRSRSEEAAAVAELQQRLTELTPRIPGTNANILLNVAAFATMVVAGVSPLAPTASDLIGWGANYGPLTAGGQWWRLFASMFLHVGLFHLAMNMWALLSLGRLVERMLGTTAFFVAYLLSGWAGALLSVGLKPYTVSAGASGAIFGVYGVLLAFILKESRSIPVLALRPLRNSALFFIGFNLWIGVTNVRIDLAAHVGGFVAGLVSGVALAHELTPEARRRSCKGACRTSSPCTRRSTLDPIVLARCARRGRRDGPLAAHPCAEHAAELPPGDEAEEHGRHRREADPHEQVDAELESGERRRQRRA